MISSLYQTRLGISPQGTLCISSQPTDSQPTGPCPITRLPTELLTDILSLAAAFNSTSPIPQVCKHWHRAYEPVLYHTLQLGNDDREARLQSHRLRQALIQKPRLGGYVRMLDVVLYNPREGTCRLVVDVMKMCPGVRALALSSTKSTILQTICEAGARLHRLEELSMGVRSIERGGLPLQMVLANFKHRPLRVLHLSRYGLGEEHTPYVEWPTPRSVAQKGLDELSQLVPRQGTTHMTTMTLYDPYAPPAAAEILLRWPKALVHLSITGIFHGHHGGNYTVEALQRMLDIHRPSLQTVRIGNYSGELPGIPDFRSFPKLHQLWLSMYNFLSEDSFIAALKLTTPRLAHLHTSFDTEDQHRASHSAFGSAEAEWMERFIAGKTPKGTLSNLQSMEIEYRPDSPYIEHIPWPWTHLQECQKSLRQSVFNLINSPSWTREEWFDIIAETKRSDENDYGEHP